MILVTITIQQDPADPTRVEANFKAVTTPNATNDEVEALERIAEAFKRSEGGHVAEEFRVQYDDPTSHEQTNRK